MASPKRVDTHVSTKRVDIRVSTGDEESMLSDFPCPHCKTRFDTRKGVRIHVMRWLCRGGRTGLRLPRFDTSHEQKVNELLTGNVEDDDGIDSTTSDSDDDMLNQSEDAAWTSSADIGVPFIPAEQWNELWLLNFAINHDLSKEAQDDLREWFKYRPSTHPLAAARTIHERLRDERVYPSVEHYKFDQEFVIRSTPRGCNGPDGDPVLFRYANPIDVAISLLKNTTLHGNDPENFCFEPDLDENLFTRDISSGRWLRRTHAKVREKYPGATVLPFIWASDKTYVTGSGSQCSHPVYLTLGCLRWFIRNLDLAHAIQGFIPLLQVSKQMRKTKVFSNFNAFVFHQYWDLTLKCIKDCYDAGGFHLEVAGEMRHFIPVVAFFIQDTPEGALLTGTRVGTRCKSPCRCCLVKEADCNNPWVKAPLREEAATREIVEPLLDAIENRAHGLVVRANLELTALGINPFRPSTWDVPYGDNPHGIYGATPPEVLHQFDLGIIKHAYLCFLDMVKAGCRTDAENTEKLRVLDYRLMSIAIRHADDTMPRIRFSNGASSIALFKASEYAPLMWQVMVVLGVGNDEAILDVVQKKKVVKCFGLLLRLRGFISKKVHTSESLRELETLTPFVLQNFKDTFKEYQASNFKFPKFHLTLHYANFIREYGSALSASTTHGERQHKTQVKPLHKRTSRKKRTAQAEMYNIAEIKVQLMQLIAHYGIFIPRERARIIDPLPTMRAHRDEYTMTGIFHTLTSLTPEGVSPEFSHLINDPAIFKGYASLSL